MAKLASDPPLSVLIGAYACSPIRGSEPGVGWGFVSRLADYANLTVIVESQFESEITKFIDESESQRLKNIKFIYVKRKKYKFLQAVYPPSYYWSYKSWQKKAFKEAKLLEHRQDQNFDIVHHLTMVGFREPGFLYKLGSPLLIGPVGGAGYFPWRFMLEMGAKGAIYYFLYNIYNFLDSNLAVRLRLISRRKRAAAIAATEENRKLLTNLGFRNVLIIPEVGPADTEYSLESKRVLKNRDKIRIIWCGQLIYRKGLKFLLLALARLSNIENIEIHIVGDGPLLGKSKTLTESFNLTKSVIYHGELPRENVMSLMHDCDIGVITSLRDLSSTVAIEMQQAGLAIIAPDHSGFTAMFNHNSTKLISLTTPKNFVEDIASALQFYIDHEDVLHTHGLQNRENSNLFSWDKKTQKIIDIYHRLVEIK